MPNLESSWPDWKYPEWREKGGQLTADGWLEGRREVDGAEGLWRVHDGLYELSSWVHSHPGGSQWLEITKGTDITEAFEAHHIGPLASKMLENFYVRPAKTPRNSAFTFHPDGFYRTLKSRVYEKLKGVRPGPSEHSKRLLETLAIGTLMFSVLAAVYHSYLLGAVAGLLLTLTANCAHNFFHMRDNWRMFLFNLSLFTVRQWRITHALSHHLFPNTHYDLEISSFEPLMMFLPSPEKTKLFGITSAVVSPLLYPFFYFFEALRRILKTKFHSQDLISLVLPTAMLFVGRVPVLDVILMWTYINMISSFWFGVIGLNAAHHHPEIFHYGDKPREDRDWGLHTLDATRDRVEVMGSPNLVLVTYGDHSLHHLFPTIDHVHLSSLYPVMEQTCREFGYNFKLKTTWDLVTGQFRQLMRNEPNLKDQNQ
uniref:Cytochrome b5 heme-binding domain-containing protein n=2 Tax=Homalodisca liturata TaxID=320908 RepID=A0A1B6H6A9_9HEMI